MSRYTICALILQVTLAGMLMASDGNAQTNKGMEDVFLSLELKNKTLKHVFEQITQLTDFKFAYEEGRLAINKKISLEANNTSLKKILLGISKKNGLSFRRVGNQIFVVKHSGTPLVEELQIGADVTISGKVTDETGEGLPGATIVLKGTTIGTTAALDGSYKLNIPEEAILVVSFVGYQAQEVAVAGRSVVDIQFKADSEVLEEVVVVAFGVQKKESVISSIETVRPSELRVPSSNLTTALAGRVSGLIAYQRSGEPGQDDANFFIRGVTTFSNVASPLILIDGVEMTSTDLSRLQTDDIESFSIMKDAAATALYGARGANGVVLVQTKEGKEGKTTVSVRIESSVSMPTRELKIADPITYMRLNNEAVRTRNKLSDVPYSQQKIENTQLGLNNYVYPANDWQDLLLKNNTMNYRGNFNVSGGGKVARYYIASSFSQDNGTLKVDKKNNFNNNIDLKKYLLRSNININLTPSTEAIVRLHGTFDDYRGPLDGGKDTYQKILRADPVLFPAYYEADETYQYVDHILYGNSEQGQYINPYADLVKGYKDYSRSVVLAQLELKQNLSFIAKGLKLHALFNLTRTTFFDLQRSTVPFWYNVADYDRQSDSYSLTQLNPGQGQQFLSYNDSDGKKEIAATNYSQFTLNYDREFNKHSISGLLVGIRRSKLTPNAGSLQESLPERNLGVSGRFTYSFDSRYFTEFNFGYNGSERFAKNERFGFFPSVGLAWYVSNEPFWGGNLSSTISKLKLKATYGLVGNDAIGNKVDRFFYLSSVNLNDTGYGYSYGENAGYYVPGVSTSRYANNQITWEIAQKLNIGVELGLWDKVEFRADIYTERRSNVLQTRADIPTTMGLQATPQSNLGVGKGRGFDLSIDYNHAFSSELWVTGRANITYAKSEYSKYEEVDNSETPWLSRIGQPIGQTYGYIAERLFVDDIEAQNSPTQFGNPGVDYGGGDIKYKDINGDDIINSLDRVPIGFPTSPQIVYGMGLSAGYKSWDFSFFFQGLSREAFFIDPQATAPFIDVDDDASVISKNALLQVYADNHWDEENKDIYALWPRLSDKLVTNNNSTSTWWMRDGSFIRLKSVELGYNLPLRMAEKLSMSSFRLYASGTNLLTFSKFKLWDPEQAENGLGYPIQKVFNLGIKASF
ncbi:TonB-dependent receptor [Reichenbachiella sp. MALMAid0571]|uniref:TonB-dependent receptor n=1 Tax=Reichenbachiella sp. MALMAid0571 TaxID=3143939 RepID=UPI0032DE7B38